MASADNAGVGVQTHNFGNDDIVIMTGKKGSAYREYESQIVGSSALEEV